VAAVRDATLEVQRGEIFGIIGPNGSGKTTTVECLQGLRQADGGELSVLGLDPRTEGAALRHRIGSQLQESALPDRIRVWEALDLFASLSPRSRDWQSLAREWDIYEKKDSAFASLSGGQRQRLFIALSLVNDPELVFLDEMTTGLDPTARRLAWDLVRQVRERGTTVVLVTHFMDEAETLCDRIAVFRGGEVIAVDTAGGLVARASGGTKVTFSGPPADLPWLFEVPGVEGVEHEGSHFRVEGTGPLLAHVAAALVAHGLAPVDLEAQRPTLEDAFMQLTGSGES
jgi:ABC-2 type transport system ATP-binding protein